MGKDFSELILELHKKQLTIILALDRHKNMFLSEIRKLIRSNYDYTTSYLNDLKRRGLVEEYRIGRYRIYRITSKGEMFANAVKKIFGIMG